MEIKDVNLGTKFELILYDYDGTEKKPNYISQLEEILDDRTIDVAAPISEGKIIPISLENKLKIVFYHEKGLFFFKGKVIKRGKKENVVALRIEIISDFEKIQRREYFRFNWVMSVKFRLIGEEPTEAAVDDGNASSNIEGQEDGFIDVLSKDISGGGLGIVTSDRYKIDDMCEVILDLENDKKVRIHGKIVRSLLCERESGKYDTGLTYEEISSRDRDAIIKFIFDKQMKLKQKGMI